LLQLNRALARDYPLLTLQVIDIDREVDATTKAQFTAAVPVLFIDSISTENELGRYNFEHRMLTRQ
jgi:hypothetical protein